MVLKTKSIEFLLVLILGILLVSGCFSAGGADYSSEMSYKEDATLIKNSESGLKAGFADDNKQFNYFISFLDEFKVVEHFALNIQERIILHITDINGKSLPNAEVNIYSGQELLSSGRTYADGSFNFFPLDTGSNKGNYKAVINFNQIKKEVPFSRQGERNIDIDLELARPEYNNVPLDILFIMDTTGSMGEEIERLKATIEIINANLDSLSSKPRLRFGMVLYRDREDEYLTKIIPLTDNLTKFERELKKVSADGGGDLPEDLQAAMEDSIKKIEWEPTGIRLAFIITDAPPQLSKYNQEYTYIDAIRDAKKQAIKIHSVGTGGLNINGEYILRQISQYTHSKYIFLTYGEAGESEGGASGSVSHHTGSNFMTDKLETIIIRFAKEELSYLTNQPLGEGEEYFEAIKIDDEERETTLQSLFDMVVEQLLDYSSVMISDGTPVASMPFVPAESGLELNAEYFTDQMLESLASAKTFRLVERKDIQTILEEIELQLSDLSNQENAVRIGEILGAKMLITGSMYKRDTYYEIFIKLLKVETSEILAVTKAKIDFDLGL